MPIDVSFFAWLNAIKKKKKKSNFDQKTLLYSLRTVVWQIIVFFIEVAFKHWPIILIKNIVYLYLKNNSVGWIEDSKQTLQDNAN